MYTKVLPSTLFWQRAQIQQIQSFHPIFGLFLVVRRTYAPYPSHYLWERNLKKRLYFRSRCVHSTRLVLSIENAKILRRLSLSHILPRSFFVDLAIVLIAEVSSFLFLFARLYHQTKKTFKQKSKIFQRVKRETKKKLAAGRCRSHTWGIPQYKDHSVSSFHRVQIL